MRHGSRPAAMPRVTATAVTTTLGPGCVERQSATITRPIMRRTVGATGAMPMIANTTAAR